MNYYLSVLKKYAVFNGRATRAEYWYFVLFNFIVAVVLAIIDASAGLYIGSVIGLLGAIYALAVLIPNLAVSVRRLHDINRSGWWLLICLVPFVGAIILLVFFLTKSKADNKYGPSPKEAMVVPNNLPNQGNPSNNLNQSA